MKIKKEKELKEHTYYKIIEYCCSRMRQAVEDFYLFNLENGELIVSAQNDAEYSFREKIEYCPFCGEPLEQE